MGSTKPLLMKRQAAKVNGKSSCLSVSGRGQGEEGAKKGRRGWEGARRRKHRKE